MEVINIYVLTSLNGTILHNRKSNALSALIDVSLVEDGLTVLRYKVGKHAGKYSTINTYRFEGIKNGGQEEEEEERI